MTHLIDKDALVAEIERRKEINKYRDSNDSLFEDEAIISFIGTLEVKEVDFEKAYKSYMKSLKDDIYGNNVTVNIKYLARHFFELGMSVNNKAQKGE